MRVTAIAPKTPSGSFSLAIFLALFRGSVFQDDLVRYPVSQYRDLIVILQRDVDDLVDLFSRTHDADGNHALFEQDAFVNPPPFRRHVDGQAAADLLDLRIPNLVMPRAERLLRPRHGR